MKTSSSTQHEVYASGVCSCVGRLIKAQSTLNPCYCVSIIALILQQAVHGLEVPVRFPKGIKSLQHKAQSAVTPGHQLVAMNMRVALKPPFPSTLHFTHALLTSSCKLYELPHLVTLLLDGPGHIAGSITGGRQRIRQRHQAQGGCLSVWQWLVCQRGGSQRHLPHTREWT
jgi:hypothetical protein